MWGLRFRGLGFSVDVVEDLRWKGCLAFRV